MHDADIDDPPACQAPFDEASQAIAAIAPFAGEFAPAGGLLAYGAHLTGEAYCDPVPGDPQAAFAEAKLGYDPTNEAAPALASPAHGDAGAAHDPELSCLVAGDLGGTSLSGTGDAQMAGFDYDAEHSAGSCGGFDYPADSPADGTGAAGSDSGASSGDTGTAAQ